MRLLCLVEGQGDVQALPSLLSRLVPTVVAATMRIQAGKVFAGNWTQVEQLVELERRKGSEAVLLLLDTDCELDRCPKARAAALQQSLKTVAGNMRAAIVLAECEFETWFIEAAESLRGVRGLPPDLTRPENPLKRGSKEWLGNLMPHGYRETQDQKPLASNMDLRLARDRSRSFRKFCRAITYLSGCGLIG